MKITKFTKFIECYVIVLFCTMISARPVLGWGGDWPTPWSHNLARPILFVHGINADMGSWGARIGISWPPENDYAQGWVAQYAQGSAAMQVALSNGMPQTELHSEGGRPTSYINHNGIEFYNSMSYSANENITGLDPFATIGFTNGVEWDSDRGVFQKGQPNQLYDKLIAVLDEYYTDWRTNPAQTIDVICHSQGCLVIRNIIANKRDQSLANPVNHLHAIISVNSPAVGTALGTDGSGVHSIQRMRDIVFSLYNQGLLDPLHGKIYGMSFTIDPFADVRKMLQNFSIRQKELKYPSGVSVGGWSPTTSIMSTAGESQGSPIITPLVNAPMSLPYNNAKIPITALYGTSPGVGGSLLTYARATGLSACTKDYLGISPDDVSWWFAPWVKLATGKAGTCSDWVNYVSDYLGPILSEMDTEWSPNSDFVVDVASQKYMGVFNPFNHPFVAKQLIPFQNESAVPHMRFGAIGYNGGNLRGATEHGEEFFSALISVPKQKSIVPILLPILQ